MLLVSVDCQFYISPFRFLWPLLSRTTKKKKKKKKKDPKPTKTGALISYRITMYYNFDMILVILDGMINSKVDLILHFYVLTVIKA